MHSTANTHCTHGSLTSGYSWFIQSILATLAFTSLIVKRYVEPVAERRSWEVWFLDTSKQAIGASVIHFTNVFTADLFPGTNPCTVYGISFLLDSSIGILVIYLAIRLTQVIAMKYKVNCLIFGEYGYPQPKYKYWIVQCIAYIFIMFIEKLAITAILQLNFWDQIQDLILWPISSPETELVIVVLVIPFIVNAFMFWVTDNFLIMHRFRSSKSDVSHTQRNTLFSKCVFWKKKPFNLFTRPKLDNLCSRREISVVVVDDDADLIEVNLEYNQQSMIDA